jgi:hypothetical protein
MDNSEQTGEFSAGLPDSFAKSSPLLKSQNGDGSHHRFANFLVRVLRGLSICAAIWGTMNSRRRAN